jgi:cytidylate kinase
LAVIALARHFGSGGEEIARQVGIALGYSCVDKELIVEVAREARVDKSALADTDERGRHPLTHFLMKYLVGQRHLIPGWGMDYAWSDELDMEAAKEGQGRLSPQASRTFFESVIKKLADRDRVIVVGRGAGAVLSGRSGVLSVCIRASLEYRTEKVMAESGTDRDEALRLIERTDIGRARYLKQHYGLVWDDPRHYHLVIDAGSLSMPAVVDMVSRAALDFGATLADESVN